MNDRKVLFCGESGVRARARRRRSQTESRMAVAVASITKAIAPARAGVGIRETRCEGDELVTVGICGCGGNGTSDDDCREEFGAKLFAEAFDVTSVSEVEEDADEELEVNVGKVLEVPAEVLPEAGVIVGKIGTGGDWALLVLTEEVDSGMVEVSVVEDENMDSESDDSESEVVSCVDVATTPDMELVGGVEATASEHPGMASHRRSMGRICLTGIFSAGCMVDGEAIDCA